MKSIITLTIAIFILSLIQGCGKDDKKEANTTTPLVSKHFLLGDPETLIEGATNNSTSFITTSNIEDFSNFYLAGIHIFEQQEELEEDDEGSINIETGQEATENDRTKRKRDNYKFDKSNYTYASTNGGKFSFLFKADDSTGRVNLVKIKHSGGEEVTVEQSLPMHYSLKNDGSAFSILAFVIENGNKIMITISFSKEFEEDPTTKPYDAVKDYKYLYGEGVRVRWDKTKKLKISVCTNNQQMVTGNLLSNETATWKKTLEGLLDVEVETLWGGFPPFSDLNTHCIYVVDNYKRTQNENVASLAVTMPTANLSRHEIIDSDIIFWKSELAKLDYAYSDNAKTAYTMKHELGHLFGLDHMFQEYTPSVMSYQSMINVEIHYTPAYPGLTRYDVEAITELYK